MQTKTTKNQNKPQKQREPNIIFIKTRTQIKAYQAKTFKVTTAQENHFQLATIVTDYQLLSK